MKKPVALIIRDGWGINPSGREGAKRDGNAVLLSRTPFHESLAAKYPKATLQCSGEAVGLPEGQMGNSEVGHLNLGAGRVVYQDLTRISKAIREGELARNEVLGAALKKAKASGGAVHFIGLLSDGGVHSHEDHLHALIRVAKEAGIKDILVHALLDGRDTSPTGGKSYLANLKAAIGKIGAGEIATVVGRYFGMDRDKRWERVKKAWDLIVHGVGDAAADPVAAVEAKYAEGVTDEFMTPIALNRSRRPLVRDGDSIVFFNFRSDRGRQLSQPFLFENFDGFELGGRPKVHYVTMTVYDKTFPCPVIFGPQTLDDIFGQVASRAGKTQVRIAETEKYPHVTYFFNGGIEVPFDGEERIMIPSPKVATYDLQPEMSAPEVTEKAVGALKSGKFDFMVLNFANPDMVGHTGSLPAAIRAVECIDGCTKRVVEALLEMGGKALVTADHGNCEQMIAGDGSPHTAHTTNLVELYYVAADAGEYQVLPGILADVAPTLLEMGGLEKPAAMTGTSRLKRKA
ncbi:MAG TPA: 2,3-bisphosphoglycerate-independent phosphoglycerate mutase [Verrucomicrobiae bacterium]|nr:2,3-bisphosphoglycerate-independent phosphoglycerate mutase [Verrucomicrobiae bacterium]